MIHKITIENFYSIAEKQEIDFRVSANTPDLACFRDSKTTPGTRLPLIVGVYGANASGKSTVLRAIISLLAFVQQSVSMAPDSPIQFFTPFLKSGWMSKPTVIVVEADAQFGGKMVALRYELRIAHSPNKFSSHVEYESLSHTPKGRLRRIFERKQQEFNFGREFEITNLDSRVQSIRANASIISTLAQFNHKLSAELIGSCRGLLSNIAGLSKAEGVLPNVLAFYAQAPETLQKLNQELGRLDLGLEEMKLHNGAGGTMASFKHLGLDSDVIMSLESAGTRKFIEIFPILQLVIDRSGVAVIDELDTDIHPLLIPEIFRWFYDPKRNPHGAQLIFTAQNPSILDELEKEQVFFAEKPSGKPTRVYGARDIKGLRREPSLMKKYLAGELGAVPRIG